jgi:bifunctional DNA-binding transcriptional regulator/antitoxin component of YhaV-PrlF toxin-antitoxin module
VVPVELRRELGLEDGSELAIHSEGRRLILEPRSEVLRRVRGRFAVVSDDVSLSDELLADRRAESDREGAE